MQEARIDETDEERLRQLLAVEQRLQELVRTATSNAARRVAAARAANEARVATARAALEQADSESVSAELALHNQALATIETAHQAALATIASVPESLVDELARWAIVHAIGDEGEPA